VYAQQVESCGYVNLITGSLIMFVHQGALQDIFYGDRPDNY
jgi:hypothetical protein